jgi:hypothetical protein
MKRFTMMTAIALGLVALTPACGGGAAGGEAKSADSAESDGRAIDKLTAFSEGIQKDVDSIFQPLNDADAAIDAVSKLPAELKASIKGKVSIDSKKISAVATKLISSGELDISSLGLDAEAEAKAKVEEAFGKLKAVVDGIKSIDQKVASVAEKVKGAVVEVPKLAAQATAGATVSLNNPFAGAEVKAQAKADMDKIVQIKDSFTAKAEEWQKNITDAPNKAKAAQEKLAKAFTK